MGEQKRTGGLTILRETVWHTALTFLSTLAIQSISFAILAVAAHVLPIEAFARLSLIVAAVMLSSAFFEFGLNVTSTKMYGDTRDEWFLIAASRVRLACVPISALLGLCVAFLEGGPDIGIGIGLGAILNLWNGVRASDQARQDYRSFTRASLAFAAVRGILGLTALYLTRDPIVVAFATYALPVLMSVLSSSARYLMVAPSMLARRPTVTMIKYAAYVYLNALTFILIPYLPQFVISHRLDVAAVSTYGLILTFTGPISLLVYSLRSVLLPKMLGSGAHFEEILWSRHGAAVIGGAWLALMIGGVAIGFGLEIFYGYKFSGIRQIFWLFFTGFSATAMIGLYSLSVHTQGVPQLGVVVGVGKVAVLAGFLIFAGQNLIIIVAMTAFVMVLSEIVLAGILAARRRGVIT